MSLEQILLYLANNTFPYHYIFIFYVLSIIALSLPIPYTFIIIANVYVFGWIGFFIVILSVPLGSFITYMYIKKFSNIIIKFKIFEKIYNKKINKKIKFHKNIYILFFVRATFPFFLVSVIFTLMNMSLKKYLNITIIGTFLNIVLVSSIINSIRDSIINYNDIVISWNDPRFFLSIIILFLFVYLSKKMNLKLYDEKK